MRCRMKFVGRDKKFPWVCGHVCSCSPKLREVSQPRDNGGRLYAPGHNLSRQYQGVAAPGYEVRAELRFDTAD